MILFAYLKKILGQLSLGKYDGMPSLSNQKLHGLQATEDFAVHHPIILNNVDMHNKNKFPVIL